MMSVSENAPRNYRNNWDGEPMKKFTYYNCPNRHIGCHAECENYKEARTMLDELNKTRREENAKRDLALEYTINDMRRKKKERTKKG